MTMAKRKAAAKPAPVANAPTQERARQAPAGVRRVPGDAAGVPKHLIESAVAWLRQEDLITDRQATAAEIYAQLTAEIVSFGFPPSPIANIGMVVQHGRPREIPERVLVAARRLSRAAAAADGVSRATVEAVAVADFLPRRGEQVVVLRKALDAVADALGL